MRCFFLLTVFVKLVISGEVLTLKQAEIKRQKSQQNCDLNGENLKIITINDERIIQINSDLNLDVKLEAYKIEEFEGLLPDILENLAFCCNFTFELFVPKQQYFYGTARKLENGSIYKSGLFSYLLDKDFDLILSDLTVNYERSQVVNFMHHFTSDALAIAIKNDLHSYLDFAMFWSPLSLEIWILLILFCIFPPILMSLQDTFLMDEKFKIYRFCSRIFESFSANFGGNFLSKNSNPFNRLVIFSYFINSIVIWITYRASVTAVLSQRKLKVPFSDLEGLANSDFTMMTQPENNIAYMFTKAPFGSLERFIFENNMNQDESFLPIQEGLAKVLENSKFAYYDYHIQMAMLMGNQRCKFKFVSKKFPPDKLAFAMRKKDPKFSKMNAALIKMSENGHLHKLKKFHNIGDELNCQANNPIVSSIGFDKLISIFIFLSASVFLSGFLLLSEMAIFKCTKEVI